MIKLERNDAFKWYEKDNVYAKGYVYSSGKTIKGLGLCEYFKELVFQDKLNNLKEVNGCFSCIVNYNNNIFLITDRISSFPLYYSKDGQYISDSTDIIINELKGKVNIDKDNMIELLSSSYITGEDTVYKEIKVVNLGQYVKISKNHIERKYYFKHIHNYENKIESQKLKEDYKLRNDKIFNNLISSLEGKTVVIPLSGGYDSRYIACMLKKKKYDKVICYTYGDKDTYEVKYSRKVAEQLGYEWHFVEYNKKEWKKIFDEEFIKYCQFEHNYISVPNVQDYIALKKLKEQGIIDNNCVIVNGFCGDLPAGSFLINQSDKEFLNLTDDWLTNYIYRQNYKHIKIRKEYEKVIKYKIKKHILDLGIKIEDLNSFMKIYEEWFTGARPCKWVVNTNRMYEFFGIEWRMPLWDNEFIDFFYNLDYQNREGCKFYKQYLFDELFIPYNVDFKKPEFVTKKNLKYSNSIKIKIKKIILFILNNIRVITGQSIIKGNDVNNYAIFSLILSKKIKKKIS